MNWNEILEKYRDFGHFCDITRLYCLSSVISSMRWLGQQITEKEQTERAQVVYDYYLDTDIQISKISDIICKHWKKYEEDEDFNIYDYVDNINYEGDEDYE